MAVLERFSLPISLDDQGLPFTVRLHIGLFSAIVPFKGNPRRLTAIEEVFFPALHPDVDPVTFFNHVCYEDLIRSSGFDIRVAFDCCSAGIGGCRYQISGGDPDDDTLPNPLDPPRSGSCFMAKQYESRIFQEKKLRLGRCSGETAPSSALHEG